MTTGAARPATSGTATVATHAGRHEAAQPGSPITGITGEFLDTLDHSDDVADLPGLDCDGDDPAAPPADSDDASAPQLPVTGISLTIPVLIGVISVTAGALMLTATRSRTEQATQG